MEFLKVWSDTIVIRKEMGKMNKLKWLIIKMVLVGLLTVWMAAILMKAISWLFERFVCGRFFVYVVNYTIDRQSGKSVVLPVVLGGEFDE